jgi:outer membrane protein assembly factor BamD (BamD/ComL family)
MPTPTRRRRRSARALAERFRNRFQRPATSRIRPTWRKRRQGGDFEKAIAILTDLITRYPDLKTTGEKLAELRDRIALREFRALVDQGKQEFEKRNLDAAEDLFEKARQKRECKT